MNKTSMTDVPKISLFGIPIHSITMDQTIDIVDQVVRNHGLLQIGVVNAAKIVKMHQSEMMMQDVLSSDLILADGAAVVLASHILGQPLPERVAGIDLMYRIFEHGNKCRYRIYCLGADEEVSTKVAERIHEDYPNVELVGRRNGYFSEDEEEGIALDIANSHPDVLFVAMTSPKKEMFLARWSDKIGVPVCHGVGGSFDVMAGKVERAPESWQRLGLEWLYRVKQEPRRLWRRYLVTNSIFCWMIVVELLRRPFRRGGDAGNY